MPRGPLPSGNARRRNAPTIPTTKLPAAGRQGPAPKIPSWVHLAKAGRAWWRWAWSTPQAAAWSTGDEPFVARRASLEDDLAALRDVDGLDLFVLADAESDAQLKSIVRSLAALVGGRLGILREMRELDNRLGLNPKAMADLRWSIEADEDAGAELGSAEGSKVRALRAVRAVDPDAVAGA